MLIGVIWIYGNRDDNAVRLLQNNCADIRTLINLEKIYNLAVSMS